MNHHKITASSTFLCAIIATNEAWKITVMDGVVM